MYQIRKYVIPVYPLKSLSDGYLLSMLLFSNILSEFSFHILGALNNTSKQILID